MQHCEDVILLARPGYSYDSNIQALRSLKEYTKYFNAYFHHGVHSVARRVLRLVHSVE
jgi:hypothetical protein